MNYFVHRQRRKTACEISGFTLIEALVGTVCGVLLIIAIVLMLMSGLKFFRTEEGRTSTLQNILLAYDRIQADIRQTIFYPALKHNDVVEVKDGGRVLTLTIFDKEMTPVSSGQMLDINSRIIVFSLQAVPGRSDLFNLVRTEDGVRTVLKSIRVRGIQFGKDIRTVPGEERTSILKMFITAYSRDEKLDKVVFPFIFVLEPETSYMRDKYWQSGF